MRYLGIGLHLFNLVFHGKYIVFDEIDLCTYATESSLELFEYFVYTMGVAMR